MTTETWSGACLRGVCWVGGLVVDRIVDALVCLAQESVRIILCVIGRVSTGRLGARYWVSTSGLSTQSSSGGLPTPPLYITIAKKKGGGGGDLVLKMVSRLDAFSGYPCPDVANQPCSWRNNWHTRGSSVPVLSY